MDLSPARWIWLPSQRTLANTFVSFRKRFRLDGPPARAAGFVSADSRYRLTVNGSIVQYGPGPCDPRALEADPVDLSAVLVEGENEIEATVLFYGWGDGTWVCGKPGFIAKLDIEVPGSAPWTVATDASWECRLDPTRPPGAQKRWYLRALQEIADLSAPQTPWLHAMELDAPAEKPPLAGSYGDYLYDALAAPECCSLVPRKIALLSETEPVSARPVYSRRLRWTGDRELYFKFRTPGLFEIDEGDDIHEARAEGILLPAAAPNEAAVLTLRIDRHRIGRPYVVLDAPLGTTVEILLAESHDPSRTRWLDSNHYRWLHFRCAEGENRFQAFEYDSMLWMQLHVMGNTAPVTVRECGLVERVYPFPIVPRNITSDPELSRLYDACVNTVLNNAHDTLVDCMGRERQQYSGDAGHETLAVMCAFGEYRHAARYLSTWSSGLSGEGYFMDAWPAYDRMNRIPQRMLGLTPWGPLLDHSVGFVFDTWNYALFSGDVDTVRDIVPRFGRLLSYLDGLRRADPDGCLPVENLGIPTVWMDHDGYRRQKHKQCAFSLYAAAAARHALEPLARLCGDGALADRAAAFAADLLDAVCRRFWSAERRLFVVNLPWLEEEKEERCCDRSLATALLFGLCPGNDTQAAADMLAERPQCMGYSYVPNQIWRHRALAAAGRSEILLKEYRGEWAGMKSVLENGSISELWHPRSDSVDQFSHLGIVPLIVLYLDLAGIQPIEPGFARYRVRPALADLPPLDLRYRMPGGELRFTVRTEADGTRMLDLRLPQTGSGTLELGGVCIPLPQGGGYTARLP